MLTGINRLGLILFIFTVPFYYYGDEGYGIVYLIAMLIFASMFFYEKEKK